MKAFAWMILALLFIRINSGAQPAIQAKVQLIRKVFVEVNNTFKGNVPVIVKKRSLKLIGYLYDSTLIKLREIGYTDERFEANEVLMWKNMYSVFQGIQKNKKYIDGIIGQAV